MKRHHRLLALALAVFSAAAGAQPAAYPNKPIRLVIGFAPAVLAATGKRGANLIVNTVGGSVFAEDVRALAFEGRLATVGYVDGVMHAEIDLAALHAKRLTLFGVSNKLRSKAQRSAAVPRFVAEVVPLIAAGRIEPRIDRVVDFARLADAEARMEDGAHVGKIVLRMPVAS